MSTHLKKGKTGSGTVSEVSGSVAGTESAASRADCQGETFVVACGDPEAPAAGAAAFTGRRETPRCGWAMCGLGGAFSRVYGGHDRRGGLSAESRPGLASDAHALWLDDVLSALGVERVLRGSVAGRMAGARLCDAAAGAGARRRGAVPGRCRAAVGRRGEQDCCACAGWCASAGPAIQSNSSR